MKLSLDTLPLFLRMVVKIMVMILNNQMQLAMALKLNNMYDGINRTLDTIVADSSFSIKALNDIDKDA